MRVLIVNTVPYDHAGISNVIYQYYYAIKSNDTSFDFLGINEVPDELKEEIKHRGGKNYVLSNRNTNPIKYVLQLARICRKGKYDVVHGHGNSCTLAFEMIGAMLGGVRVRMAHSHSTKCKHVWLNRLLKPLFFLSCTHRIACGKEAGKWLYGQSSFEIVNNSIQTERFVFNDSSREQIRHDYSIGENDIVIGHVGRIDKNKNQAFIVDVLRELAKKKEQYRLFLIGDGEERDRVAAKVQEFKLEDKVFFVGNVKNVEDYLSACDLIVMPSYYEGLPLSLIEEQANGLPCIVSDTITREVDKTGLCTFLSLEAGVCAWAERIGSVNTDINRKDRSCRACELIQKAGYDVKEEARKLEDYYIQSSRR